MAASLPRELAALGSVSAQMGAVDHVFEPAIAAGRAVLFAFHDRPGTLRVLQRR